jgi:hypothetical protein
MVGKLLKRLAGSSASTSGVGETLVRQNPSVERRDRSGAVGHPLPSAWVKMHVWRRDHGRCVLCEGQESVWFDSQERSSSLGSTSTRSTPFLQQSTISRVASRALMRSQPWFPKTRSWPPPRSALRMPSSLVLSFFFSSVLRLASARRKGRTRNGCGSALSSRLARALWPPTSAPPQSQDVIRRGKQSRGYTCYPALRFHCTHRKGPLAWGPTRYSSGWYIQLTLVQG